MGKDKRPHNYLKIAEESVSIHAPTRGATG